MFDVGNVALFLWISFLHCWTLYLCYLGSQIWDHHRDPNVGHGAKKKTRISWQEGRTGRRGLFPSEREVGAVERSRLWSLCWKLPQICGLIQILILLPGPHWVSPTRHHWSDNKTFSCAHLILFDHLMDWGWNEVWWEVDGGGRWQDQMQCWGGKVGKGWWGWGMMIMG